MCGHCGFVFVFGNKWTSKRSGCGCPVVRRQEGSERESCV